MKVLIVAVCLLAMLYPQSTPARQGDNRSLLHADERPDLIFSEREQIRLTITMDAVMYRVGGIARLRIELQNAADVPVYCPKLDLRRLYCMIELRDAEGRFVPFALGASSVQVDRIPEANDFALLEPGQALELYLTVLLNGGSPPGEGIDGVAKISQASSYTIAVSVRNTNVVVHGSGRQLKTLTGKLVSQGYQFEVC